METITIKMENAMLKEIDGKLKANRYSTRTEFIRDAIRKRLADLDMQVFVKQLLKLKGASKKKTTDEELELIREKAFNELEKKKFI